MNPLAQSSAENERTDKVDERCCSAACFLTAMFTTMKARTCQGQLIPGGTFRHLASILGLCHHGSGRFTSLYVGWIAIDWKEN